MLSRLRKISEKKDMALHFLQVSWMSGLMEGTEFSCFLSRLLRDRGMSMVETATGHSREDRSEKGM